jgi:hypothetical protein
MLTDADVCWHMLTYAGSVYLISIIFSHGEQRMLTDADGCWQRVLHFVYFPHEQRGVAADDWRHYGPGTLLALLVRCDTLYFTRFTSTLQHALLYSLY